MDYAMNEVVKSCNTTHAQRTQFISYTLGQSHQTMNCFECDLNGDAIIKLTINHLLDNDTNVVVLPQNTTTVDFKPNN